jgi:hypothetical protein
MEFLSGGSVWDVLRTGYIVHVVSLYENVWSLMVLLG